MELRHLRSLLTLAESKHFGRAARQLHVSQPALSQQIRQLEDELGTPLFERRRGDVRLTQAGEALRTYASRALEDVHAGERAVAALRGLARGTLRVGYLPSHRGLVVHGLSAVLAKYPGVHVAAEEAVASRVERRVLEGKLDVGLGYARDGSPDLELETVVDTRVGLLVSRRHPLASSIGPGGRVPLRRLADEPFALLARGLRARATIDAYFASNRFHPRVVLETNAVATLHAIVRAGRAITVLPAPEFGDHEQMPVLQLSPAPATQTTALVWRASVPRSPAAEAFATEIRARAAGTIGPESR